MLHAVHMDQIAFPNCIHEDYVMLSEKKNENEIFSVLFRILIVVIVLKLVFWIFYFYARNRRRQQLMQLRNGVEQVSNIIKKSLENYSLLNFLNGIKAINGSFTVIFIITGTDKFKYQSSTEFSKLSINDNQLAP